MQIVITGVTGFAGSHILESFGENSNVIASCRDKTKLPLFHQNKAMIGDLKDGEYVEELTKKADIICHTASWAELNGGLEDSKREFLEPTLQLIDKALANGVKRFIFLSSTTSKPIEEKRLHTSLSLEKIWAHYASIVAIEKHLKEVSQQGMEVIVLRVGLFTGKNYSLGLLPILLPRLKTHLVPYVEKGTTSLPLIDGEDIAQAFKLASEVTLDKPYEVIDIVGKEIPTVKEVLNYLHTKHNYPLPHFSVPFGFAYLFARFMRWTDRFLPFDPLIVPSIVLLLEETNANNDKAEKLLGYRPRVDWRESIEIQIAQMKSEQKTNMRMNKK